MTRPAPTGLFHSSTAWIPGPITAAADPDLDAGEVPATATIVIAVEGEESSDGRIVDPGALTWREPPLSLTINHDPARIAGRVDRIWRDGNQVLGDVVFDLDGVEGAEAARMVDGGFLRGVSMEVGDMEVEWECVEEDDDGYCTRELMRLLAGKIGAVTLTPFQALEDAQVVVTAAAPTVLANPIAAPADWFADPELDRPTPLIVTDERRVFGHVAYWGVAHIGMDGRKVYAPRSSNGYELFNRKPRATSDGQFVRVGPLTMGDGHAPTTGPGRSDPAVAIRYYEDVTTVFADVTAGEDDWGIWVAGMLRSYVTAEQIEAVQGAEMSGDWRRGDLVAAHAVVTPGIPGAGTRALVASGELVALVASFTTRPPAGSDELLTARLEVVERRSAHLEAIVASLGLEGQAIDVLAASIRPAS